MLDDDGALSLGGVLVPRVSAEPNGENFAATGWRGSVATSDASQIQIERAAETYHHGGFSIAAAEFDELYASFPGFLDAASFALPDPVVGNRIFPQWWRGRSARSRSKSSACSSTSCRSLHTPAGDRENDSA